MTPGEVTAVETGACTDLYQVDTGMYDTAEYGCVYLLDAERPALVETGIGTHTDRVLAALDAVGIDRGAVETVLVTHVHLDHAGGAGFLAEALPNADFAVPEPGAAHLVDPSRLWAGTKAAVGDQLRYYTDPRPVPERRVRPLADGDRVDLGDHELVAHAAPGHAPHQFVFDHPENDAVFTADAAGISVPSLDAVQPTSPPPQFDLEQCLADVRLIEGLDRSTLCYTHFGAQPAGDRLGAYADVLREWVATVERVRAERGDEGAIDHLSADPETAAVWGEHKARGETRMNVRGVFAYLDSQAG
jgi:glyoxylase-like metal-dependent hydrolase (beta-lactamase superfamily II)